jgi:hypothetical protein
MAGFINPVQYPIPTSPGVPAGSYWACDTPYLANGQPMPIGPGSPAEAVNQIQTNWMPNQSPWQFSIQNLGCKSGLVIAGVGAAMTVYGFSTDSFFIGTIGAALIVLALISNPNYVGSSW